MTAPICLHEAPTYSDVLLVVITKLNTPPPGREQKKRFSGVRRVFQPVVPRADGHRRKAAGAAPVGVLVRSFRFRGAPRVVQRHLHHHSGGVAPAARHNFVLCREHGWSVCRFQDGL